MSKQPPKQTKVFPGAKIGYFTVIGRVNTPQGQTQRWRVECVCGQRETIRQNYLTRDNPKTSCGCKRRSIRTDYKREYGIWTMMQVRCGDPRHVSYKDYGGRGIKVHPTWLDHPIPTEGGFVEWDGFAQFLKDMGPAPSPTHTLDRIDPDSGYGPGLCRWATPKEQANNKRSDKQRAIRAQQMRERMNAEEAAKVTEINTTDPNAPIKGVIRIRS